MALPAFPYLHDQVVTQFPYSEIDSWYTAIADVPCGKSFTRSYNASPLKAFLLSYGSITKDESDLLEAFFNSMKGPLGTFTFTDDAGNLWSPCRFDQNEYSITALSANQYSGQLRIVAVGVVTPVPPSH